MGGGSVYSDIVQCLLTTDDEDSGVPVRGLQERTISRENIRVHFVHRHVRDTIVILEEGNCPHPLCPDCDMFALRSALNWWHYDTTLCAQGAKINSRRFVVQEAWDGAALAFKSYG